MRKKWWICITLLLVVPGMLLIVSCAKKTIMSEPGMSQADKDEAARRAADEEARRRALKEEQLREDASKLKGDAIQNEFLKEDVYFEYDRYDLTPEAQALLKKKAEWLRANPGVAVYIEGHCDERGTNEYNLALGDRRAEAAKAFLVDLGVASSLLTTISYGEERPVDPGHDEQAWVKNRRAHFVIE